MWHLKQFGVVLLSLALETSNVYLQKAREGLAVGETVQACVGEYEMLMWEVREGKASAYGHFQGDRVSRCCFLGIMQITGKLAES